MFVIRIKKKRFGAQLIRPACSFLLFYTLSQGQSRLRGARVLSRVLLTPLDHVSRLVSSHLTSHHSHQNASLPRADTHATTSAATSATHHAAEAAARPPAGPAALRKG